MTTAVETDRLSIRGIAKRDAAPLLEMLNDSAWLRFVGDRGVHTVEEAEAYLKTRGLGFGGDPIAGTYTVERKTDGNWLGMVSFLQRDYLEHPDIGFAFLPANRGQGYAYEASKAFLDYILGQRELPTILGITVRENEGSIRLLEKLGLRWEREMLEDSDRTAVQIYRRDFE